MMGAKSRGVQSHQNLNNWLFALLLIIGSSLCNYATGASFMQPREEMDLLQVFDEENMEDAQHDELESTEHWIIIGLILTIVFLSLVFELLLEFLYHFLKHRKLEAVVKMLNSLYKELTILGFISLTLFVFIRTGYVQHINDEVFGVSRTEAVAIEEAEKAGESISPPTTLVEIFEDVHVFIFIIMAIFICEAAILTICGYEVMESYDFFDKKTKEDLVNDINEADAQGYSPELIESLQFYGLKERFLRPIIPIVARPSMRKSYYPEFPFASYLKKALGETLNELIELPAPVLAAVIVIVALLRPMMALPVIGTIVFMVVTAFALLLFTLGLLLIFAEIERLMKPGVEQVKKSLRDPAKHEFIAAPIDEKQLIGENMFGETCHRTHRLFPFGRKLYMRRLMQTVLFFHAAYVAVLVRNIISIAHDSRYLWWSNGWWAYPLTVIPIVASLYTWTRLINKYVIATYMDCLTSAELIEEVEKETAGEEIRRDMQIVNFLLYQAEKTLVNRIAPEQYEQEYYSRYDEQTKADIDEIFVLAREKVEEFPNKKEPGGVSLKSMKEIVEALRIIPEHNNADADYVVEDWFNIFDAEKKGYLSYDFYKIFMVHMCRLTMALRASETLNDRIRLLFDEMDANRDHVATEEEFCRFLSGMKPPLSEREAHSLTRRITGEVPEITFENMRNWISLTLIRVALQ